jgi:hypothetical protein
VLLSLLLRDGCFFHGAASCGELAAKASSAKPLGVRSGAMRPGLHASAAMTACGGASCVLCAGRFGPCDGRSKKPGRASAL